MYTHFLELDSTTVVFAKGLALSSTLLLYKFGDRHKGR